MGYSFSPYLSRSFAPSKEFLESADQSKSQELLEVDEANFSLSLKASLEKTKQKKNKGVGIYPYIIKCGNFLERSLLTLFAI